MMRSPSSGTFAFCGKGEVVGQPAGEPPARERGSAGTSHPEVQSMRLEMGVDDERR